MTATAPPPGRYDEDADSWSFTGRALAVGLVLLVAAVVVAVVVYVYRAQTAEEISGTQTGYHAVDDHTLSLQFDVTRSTPSTPVFCIVRAKEYSGAEVGRREVYVPPSDQETVRLDTTISTTAPAVQADVYGCGADIPSYLRR